MIFDSSFIIQFLAAFLAVLLVLFFGGKMILKFKVDRSFKSGKTLSLQETFYITPKIKLMVVTWGTETLLLGQDERGLNLLFHRPVSQSFQENKNEEDEGSPKK